MIELSQDQIDQIKAVLADCGLTVRRAPGTAAKATGARKAKRYKRLCGYQGPTRAALSRGVVSTAAKLGDRCGAIITRDDIGTDVARKTHVAANKWLREHASEYGVTFGAHGQ